MGLFRRKKDEGEQRLSRIERLREWREARRVRRYEGDMRKLKREETMLPLLQRQAQAEEARVRIARGKEQQRKFKWGRRGKISMIGTTLGAIGSKAEQAQGAIFGPPSKPTTQRPYTGNPFAVATSTLTPPKPRKKKSRSKTIVIRMGR